ncbi:MAG: hypothetical protein JKY65_17100 [Planctomycetes bacterium]|nr:hypothetical protein [Planctomycetota bacterium]
MAKKLLVAGAKKALRRIIRKKLKKKLGKEGTKKGAGKATLEQAERLLDSLDNAWWENIIEFVPWLGDIYGCASFKLKFDRLQRKIRTLERRADKLGRAKDAKDAAKKAQRAAKKLREKRIPVGKPKGTPGVSPGRSTGLGPSGKRLRHQRQFNTRKGAREAGKGSDRRKQARRRGLPRRRQGRFDKHDGAPTPPGRRSGGHTHGDGPKGSDADSKVYNKNRRGGPPSLRD